MEYFAFGETFVEEHKNSHNAPWKYNGKELDEETGWYYYGARYYNSRTSIWLSVDPIAGWNPIFEIEHYIEGQHNGGVFNNKNLNVYGYCYQNPIILVDPNGKQTLSDASDWISKKAENAKKLLNKKYEEAKQSVASNMRDALSWGLDNAEELIDSGLTLLNTYAGYEEIKTGIGLLLVPEPTTATKVAGGYLIADGIVRIGSTPVILIGIWTDSPSKDSPSNLLGLVGFTLDNTLSDNQELQYHGGLKIAGEAVGDIVNAKAQLKKLAKEVLLDKSVVGKVKDWINLLDKVSKGPQESVSGAKEYENNN